MKKTRIMLIFSGILFLIVLILVIMFAYTLINQILGEKNKNDNKDVMLESNIVDSLDSYILYSDSIEYQKTLFDSLKTEKVKFENDEIKVEEYLDIYAKNFLADYLTLSVKSEETERIGGITFLESTIADGFKKSFDVRAYYSLAYNSKYAKSDLPEVKELTLIDTTEDYYINEENYVLTYSIQYSTPEEILARNDIKEDSDSTNIPRVVRFLSISSSSGGEWEAFEFVEEVNVTIVKYNGVWTVIKVENTEEDDYEILPVY